MEKSWCGGRFCSAADRTLVPVRFLREGTLFFTLLQEAPRITLQVLCGLSA